MTRMRSWRPGAWSVVAAMGVISVAAYGLLTPLIGFYWDDWPFAWIARFLGPAEFIPAFRGFRPFLGPIFFLTTSVLPADPLVWQLAALVVRFAAGLAAWFALRQAWPRHAWETSAAALLFLVYPGYSQHWVAFTHINQEWIPFIAYLLSLGISLDAVRHGSGARFVLATAAALVLEAAGLFPTEYFIGLEPLRLMLLWLVVGELTQGFRHRMLRALRSWWPYAVIWLANAWWLARYYRSGAYVSYDLTASAGAPQFSQVFAIFGDALWKAGIYVWVQVVFLLVHSIQTPTTLLTVAIVGIAFLAAVVYLRRLDLRPRPPLSDRAGSVGLEGRRATERMDDDFALPALIIGASGILLGRVPSFAAALPLTLQSSFDRFMISMMLGGTLCVLGLACIVVRSPTARTYVIAALLGLAIGQQFFNANIFRRDWQRQTDIYWQLVWRIPSLEPGTAVITTQLPLDYETDLSMTAAINWIYAAHPKPPNLSYAMVYSEKRLGGIVLPNLEHGTSMLLPLRTMEFAGNTSRVVVVYVPADGCLRVMDPTLGDGQTYSRFPDALGALIPLSRPDLIRGLAARADGLPMPPFAAPPTHSWCYYYEKAELARQVGNWQEIHTLGLKAAKAGLAPQDPFEWLPIIEAEARLGNAGTAKMLTREALRQDTKVQRGLCVVWSRVKSLGTTHVEADPMLVELGCSK